MRFDDIKIPFNDPSRKFRNDSQLIHEISKFINNGPYLKGKYLEDFENDFAEYLNVKYCIGVASGTAALELALRSFDFPAGSKIGLTANAGGYGTISILKSNLIPFYLEVDHNGLLDIEKLALINLADVKAIIVTNLYGQAVDVMALRSFTDNFGISIIEDCAQSAGAKVGRVQSGSLSSVSTFSFYPTKNLSSFGDSGAVCTNSSELANRIWALREYGWSKRYYAELSGGSNFRMDDLHALCLSRQLPRLDSDNDRRRNIWKFYEDALQNEDRLIGNYSQQFVAHLAIIFTKKRKKFLEYLENSGIRTAIHYPFPDYEQPAFRNYFQNNLDNTNEFCSSILSIPLFPEMLDSEVEYVEKVIRKWYMKKSVSYE